MMPFTLVFTLLLLATLGAISWVDVREMRIPDVLSGLLLAGGVAFWLLSPGGSLALQASSALTLAVVLWLVRHGHARMSGQVGLGLGDVKMAGAGALWINPLSLPMFLFAASAAGLVYAMLRREKTLHQRMPFAPFLSLGLFSCWIAEQYL
jgi:leader peptidase (prepilin peptidase) / N-methyltransferase